VIRGEGSTVVRGVTAGDVFDFVLDPVQYLKADTKLRAVVKLADTEDGQIAREDGTFLGFAHGSVVTRYRWTRPSRIDVTLEHGMPRGMHNWFEIEPAAEGARVTHVEELELGWGPLGAVHDLLVRGWWQRSVEREVAEIKRLLEAGARGRGPTQKRA
jgi:hypothetical protein